MIIFSSCQNLFNPDEDEPNINRSVYGGWVANDDGTDNSGLVFSIIGDTAGDKAIAVAQTDSQFFVADDDENNLEKLDFSIEDQSDKYKITATVTNGGWDTENTEIVYYAIVENNKMYMSDSSNITKENALFAYDRIVSSTNNPFAGTWIANNMGSDYSGLVFTMYSDDAVHKAISVAQPDSLFYRADNDENNLEKISFTYEDLGDKFKITATVTNGGWDADGSSIIYYVIVDGNTLYMSDDSGLTKENALFVYDKVD